MNDGYNFDMRVEITDHVIEGETPVAAEDSYHESHVLFPAKSRFTMKKSITIKHSRDLNIEVFADYFDGKSLKLAQYLVTNITDITKKEQYADAGKPKVKLTFEIGSINVIDLVKASASLDITQMVEVEVVKITPNITSIPVES